MEKAGHKELIMKKILWLCNIVLPDFCSEFAIKKCSSGGWMTGMLHAMEREDSLEIALCFPIYDKERLKDGYCNGHDYYTFLCEDTEKYHVGMIEAFERILEQEQWDIIHIWGTEFPHTTAMLLACKKKGILGRTVINIQGLVSNISNHFRADIPKKYWMQKNEDGISIKSLQRSYERRGNCEIESLKLVQYVIGRTDWDKACIEMLNPHVRYFSCGEILRDAFYDHVGEWEYTECRKHSIFVSQASYPIKGFHYLLQALPYIIKEFPDTYVCVAGIDIITRKDKEPYAIYLAELMEQLNLESYVSFLGVMNEYEMIEQYLKANVFVSASVVENESNSLSEARLIGVPTVSSFVGGAYSRISFGEDGFLYPHDEPVLLAYYIKILFRNEENICTAFSEKSVFKMKEAFVPCENADQNIKIYEEIMRSKENELSIGHNAAV